MKTKINVFSGAIIVVILSAILGLFFALDFGMVITCVSLSLFTYGKMILAMYCNTGHGVLPDPKKFRFRGFNLGMIIYFAFLGILMIRFVYFVYTIPEGEVFSAATLDNLEGVAWSFLIGFIVSFVVWDRYLYWETFHGSEYDARVELGAKYSPEVVEQKISQLKTAGVLRG